jgi:V/A-type H+-transporting ATPase subunit D
MPVARTIPPGRAGRMWLRGRLATAERGRDQLDRKLRILIPERQRLQTRLELRREAWSAAYDEAQRWLLRAVLLGGEDAVRAATPARPADVEVTWTSAMGLSYPEDVVVRDPGEDGEATGGNAAVVPATAAFRAALLAGARAAAAQEAVTRLESEIAVTRRRMRALDKRWLPWLREALARLELTLEQTEQEDGMRLRRAVGAEGRPGT